MSCKYLLPTLLMLAMGCSGTKLVGTNSAKNQEPKEAPVAPPEVAPPEVAPPEDPKENSENVEKETPHVKGVEPPTRTSQVEPPVVVEPPVATVNCSTVGAPSWWEEFFPEALKRWGDGREISSAPNPAPALTPRSLRVFWEGKIPSIDSIPAALLNKVYDYSHRDWTTSAIAAGRTEMNYYISEELTSQQACEGFLKVGKITRIENSRGLATTGTNWRSIFKEEETSYCLEKRFPSVNRCREELKNIIPEISSQFGAWVSRCYWRKAKGKEWLDAYPVCDKLLKLPIYTGGS